MQKNTLTNKVDVSDRDEGRLLDALPQESKILKAAGVVSLSRVTINSSEARRQTAPSLFWCVFLY